MKPVHVHHRNYLVFHPMLVKQSQRETFKGHRNIKNNFNGEAQCYISEDRSQGSLEMYNFHLVILVSEANNSGNEL